jgi:hypothetical protein
MTTPVNFSASPTANQRLVLSNSQSQKDPSSEGFQLTFRTPTRAEAFGRKILNLCTFGAYKRKQNRAQWNHLKLAALANIDLNDKENAGKKIGQVMANYDASKRLTVNRVAKFLADFEATQRGQKLKQKTPQALDDKQNFIARGWRTFKVRNFRSMSAQEQALRTKAQSSPKDDVSQNMLSVLRPGYPITKYAIEAGQTALKPHAELHKTVFESYSINNDISKNLGKVVNSDEWNRFSAALNQKAEDGTSPRGLFAIPLGLEQSKSVFHENHSVLLAIDMQAKKILYLDAKGYTLQDADNHYGNASGLHKGASLLGKQVFGDDWKPETGILQMSLSKQQGANDCGAFTHDFTRRLLQGESLTDIERSFTSEDRKQIRLQMAKDIDDNRPQSQLSEKPVEVAQEVDDF